MTTRDIHKLIKNNIDSVPGDSYENKIIFLSKCNCCERHKINKPFIFYPWVDTPDNFNKSNNNCACNCRHISRFICRQYPNNFTIQSPIVSRENSNDSIICEF